MDRGFAEDERALAERRAAARALIGQRIVHVAYVDIDSRGWDLGYQDQSMRRAITGASEWSEPTWDAGTFHHLDFGIELTTERDEIWGITWDNPGPDGESIRLQRGMVSDRGAVWDVTEWEPWSSCLPNPVSDIALRYHRWSDDTPPGFWCTRVSLFFNGSRVEVLLGDRDREPVLTPSADNIAVLLHFDALPQWERTRDLIW